MQEGFLLMGDLPAFSLANICNRKAFTLVAARTLQLLPPHIGAVYFHISIFTSFNFNVAALTGRGNGGACCVTQGVASSMPRPAALGIAQVNSALLSLARSVSPGYMLRIAVALSARLTHGCARFNFAIPFFNLSIFPFLSRMPQQIAPRR